MESRRIYSGFLPDANVSAALRLVMQLFNENTLAVIRSVDSTADLDGLQKILVFHEIDHCVLGDNVCIRISTLKKVVDKLFTGFDEVWLVNEDVHAQELHALSANTSDGAEFRSELPGEVVSAINHGCCELVLADGCGLNFATPRLEIAAAIRALEDE